MPKYFAFNNDAKFFGTAYGSLQKDFQMRWNYWINKLIQLGILEQFLDIIPKEEPEPQPNQA